MLALGALNQEDINFLHAGGISDLNLADKLIENGIGYFQLPLGVATNFRINDRDYVIPLAVEETSIIAALSKSAKWIRQHGEIKAWVEGQCILGQIQLAQISDFARFSRIFAENRPLLIAKANKNVCASMVQRGGGVSDLQLRHLARPDGGDMAIIHLTMNSCEAMALISLIKY